MASTFKTRDSRDLKFSFGVRELKDAELAQMEMDKGLALVVTLPGKQPKQSQGFDPYNTSGSFDRKKNWARVGKR